MKKKRNISKIIPIPKFEPVLTPNALEIVNSRYVKHNSKGIPVESPKEMFWRVAKAMASVEEKYSVKLKKSKLKEIIYNKAVEFYNIMARLDFVPGGRVLFEAGNKHIGQLSSCFVVPVPDDLNGIFEALKNAAIIQKNNGGTGFNFSHIRPKGDTVKGVPNVAAGPIHYIKTFDKAFEEILQGSKRHGANIAILNIDHPDILDFINLKGKESILKNFNISVGVTNDFMEKVRADQEYDLINPNTKKAEKRLNARLVFEMIVKKAWDCADPGMIFLDHLEAANMTPQLGKIEATNPCGEQPLLAYESCNLGSIIIPNHIEAGKINCDKLKTNVKTATRFLENMLDASTFPLKIIEENVKKTRKIGLGILGFAQGLYKLNIPYNSKKAVSLCEKIMKFVHDEAIEESIKIAKERGVFPAWKGSKWSKKKIRIRNAALTSIAPNGTISIVANSSSGIEPVFSLVIKRKVLWEKSNYYGKEKAGTSGAKELVFIDPIFEKVLKERNLYSDDLLNEVAEAGTLEHIKGIPEDIKKVFVTAHDINYEWHVKMQAAAQKYTDAAVSKTINFPNTATIHDVKKAYIAAYESGCKGITIFRDGSKEAQVLAAGNFTQNNNQEKDLSEKEIDIKVDGMKIRRKIESNLTKNGLEVLEKRSLKKDKDGNIIETPKQLWMRIAKYVASAGKFYKENKKEINKDTENFFEILNSLEFLCGGALIWAGMSTKTTKYALWTKCFVLPLEDSIESIFTTLSNNVEILKRGGGTGFNFSKLRSSYSTVKTTGEQASGPIVYLQIFDKAHDTIIGRGGRQMGAMAILNVDHPNIEDFIKVKNNNGVLSHYNISVGLSNKFMEAVRNDENWDLIDPHDKKVYKTLKAIHLFNQIAEYAWKSGDPGVVFIDELEKHNPTPELGRIDATNVCGEQPLLPYESCNLGNIDISKMVDDFPYCSEKDFYKKPLSQKIKRINWKRLEYVVDIAVKFLDNIIDINNYPIKEIERMTKKTRSLGLGVMGFADLLIKLGISYDCNESVIVAEQIMKFIQECALQSSIKLGKERGNFPAFDKSIWKTSKKIKNLRNSRITTIAPTGTISIISNCNPGIEPIFALAYKRQKSMGKVEQYVIESLFEEVAKVRGFYSVDLLKSISAGNSIQNMDEVPSDVKDVFKTSYEIDPVQHVKIQSAFQKYIDSGVSKTINLPNTASINDVKKIYKLAYDSKCKGITIFREGCKEGTIVKNNSESQNTPDINKVKALKEPRKREETMHGFTTQLRTDQGTLYVTINEDTQGIAEVFLNIGKSGGYSSGYTEAIGRLISVGLRAGIEPDVIIDQLKGIRMSAPVINKGMFIYSVPDAVGKILEKYIKEKEGAISMFKSSENVEVKSENEIKKEVEENKKEQDIKNQDEKGILKRKETSDDDNSNPNSEHQDNKYTKKNEMDDMLDCPDCGGELEYAEGCLVCRSCGFSRCG